MKAKTTRTLKKGIKFYVLSLIVFGFSINSNAQVGEYKLKYDCPVYRCDITGKFLDSTVGNIKYLTAPTGSLLDSITTINKGNQEYIKIQFHSWYIPTPLLKKDNNGKFTQEHMFSEHDTIQLRNIRYFNYHLKGVDNNDYEKILQSVKNTHQMREYFLIKVADFKAYCQKITYTSHWSFNAGSLVVPFKLRTHPFDFSKDITLSGTGAIGYRISNSFTFYGTGALGISSISIDSTNSDGKTKKSTNLSAFTISTGLVLAFLNKGQISVSCGWDMLGNDDVSKGWIYNGKPWLGLGIGFELFTAQKTGSTTSVGNNDNSQNPKSNIPKSK